jgi:flagellar hook-associated protein 2
MSDTSSIFTGNSRYASDFTSLIDRATNIASLPLLQMQKMQQTLNDRSSALSSLDAKILAFQSAVNGLADAAGSGSYKVSVGDSSVLSATVSGQVNEGSYSIEVTGMGSSALAMSKDPGGSILKVSDPSMQTLSSGESFRLYLDGDTEGIVVTPANSTLESLAAAINSAFGDLQASVVNVGGSSGADYRLSIQGRDLGSHTIELRDKDGRTIMDQLAGGAPVTYKINGGSEISNDARQITLAPGVTVNLLKQSTAGSAATIAISRQTSAVDSALTAFASAYNSVMDELSLHRGGGSGALKGDSIVSTVTGALRGVASYTNGKDGVSSLASIGLAFDKTGRLSFDPAALENATGGRFDTLTSFLGSTDGRGFLGSATGALNSLEDATNGFVKTAITSVQSQVANQQTRMADEQERIDRMKTDLQERMAAADALIASLEQKVSYITDLFAAMQSSKSN